MRVVQEALSCRIKVGDKRNFLESRGQTTLSDEIEAMSDGELSEADRAPGKAMLS